MKETNIVSNDAEMKNSDDENADEVMSTESFIRNFFTQFNY